ncbi:MAG: choice-of-anchor R domain-containing protein [Candidatus Paceibacterota bacterium]|jgi:hypothetical protein
MNYKLRIINKSGQAMITSVIFFLFISLSIVFGLASPVTSEFKISKDNIQSKQSYFLSESGIEDAYYRIKKGKNISPIETITIDGSSTTTSITDISSGEKQIQSLGDVFNKQRKITFNVETGVGISFNYGIQSGNGGLVMNNNASVIGNVYANGDIVGLNGSSITGTAISANSVALVADQVNNSPLPPASSIVFGSIVATQDLAQSFQVSTDGPINKIQLYIKKSGTPSNATVRIVTDSSGSPSNNQIASGTLSAALVSGTYGWVDVIISPNASLSAGTTYWFVIDASTSLLNYYTIGANSSYAGGVAKTGQYSSTWTTSLFDAYFQVYIGGLYSTISGIVVGLVGIGDAHAHIVTGSTVAGNLYCQTGSDNNKPCDTSKPDPTPANYPISDSNIQQWKSDAEAGGTIIGNYTPPGSVSTLGPKKITGNLTITNGHILTLTGTIWVQGTISVSNNAQIILSPSYGAGSGVMLADGNVNISNNSIFAGSGNPSSYILLLTTSICPTGSSCGGQNAMEISNNAGTVVLNAQEGTLHLSNNTGAKSITAQKILMDNNAVITYDSGLANMNFPSGPSGGWNIIGWKETQ